jgi:hypothetical protein
MIFNLDTGMSPYYGRRGGAAHITPNGISYRGFEHAKSDVIIDNPRTVVLSKEGVEGVLFNNKGVSRENFLPSLIQQVKERIRELRRVMRLGQGFTQQSITFHDESEAA